MAKLFVKLGVIGFGGPAAHIALMREEVVRRRRWLEDREFLEMVGATNLIPGPSSTELAIHLGHRRAGWRGLAVAGAGFIVPAALLVAVLAWLYERYGTTAAVVDLRYGVLPVVVAVVAHALWGLGRSTVRGPIEAAVATAALAAYLAEVDELLTLLVAGVVVALWSNRGRLRPGVAVLVAGWIPLAGSPAPGRPDGVSLWRLFAVFVKLGSVVYGSGYVLLAFLQTSLVDERGWLTADQLLDAVAVGQVTPGPVFTTATFAGWQIAGPAGAAVATVGIFLPSFAFVALLGPIVRWARGNAVAAGFLSGVTTASLGLMAGVARRLAGEALVDAVTVTAAALALVVLVRTRVNSVWLIAAGAALGAAYAALG